MKKLILVGVLATYLSDNMFGMNVQNRDSINNLLETYNNVNMQLQRSSAMSREELFNMGINTPISYSRICYTENRTDNLNNISEMCRRQHKNLNNTLAQDRKFMSNIIIWTINNNTSKLQQLIIWARNNSLNPEQVFGFDTIEKIESYRKASRMVEKFTTDVPEDVPQGNGWFEILIKGNETLQKKYAQIYGDAYELNGWMEYTTENPEEAANYLRNHVYHEGWVPRQNFSTMGNVQKLESLRRFIGSHDNEVFFGPTREKCIDIRVNQEEFDILLESEKQRLMDADVFAGQTPLDRLLTFVIQYNQENGNKITGADICNTLERLRRLTGR